MNSVNVGIAGVVLPRSETACLVWSSEYMDVISNVESLMFVNLVLDIDIWIADMLFEKTILFTRNS